MQGDCRGRRRGGDPAVQGTADPRWPRHGRRTCDPDRQGARRDRLLRGPGVRSDRPRSHSQRLLGVEHKPASIHAGGPDDARERGHRGDGDCTSANRDISATADRIAADLRRSGGHRDRERAPVRARCSSAPASCRNRSTISAPRRIAWCRPRSSPRSASSPPASPTRSRTRSISSTISRRCRSS